MLRRIRNDNYDNLFIRRLRVATVSNTRIPFFSFTSHAKFTTDSNRLPLTSTIFQERYNITVWKERTVLLVLPEQTHTHALTIEIPINVYGQPSA